MDESTRAKYEAKAQDVRASLKKWESDWADGHNGAKPGRQDIKNHPEIALQYKEYNKIREILAGKAPGSTKLPTSSSMPSLPPPKRRAEAPPMQTPVKRNKLTETPSKPANDSEYMMNSPAISRKLFSPAPVTSIGPTPQRDGRVLGLFDLLVDKELGSPSKATQQQNSPRKSRLLATPSRRRGSVSEESSALGRTPMSTSKRQMLNTFMTPLKKRDDNVGGKTPSSVSKTLQFDTPAFLKRHSLPALLENAEDAPAPPLRLPRKPLVRGLSEIVASLRRVEEDKLDDDLDALREMEHEEMGLPPPEPIVRASAATTAEPSDSEIGILERDSQSIRLPLGGLDDEGLYDSPDEEQKGRDGLPLPVFKKKGQKRTTRKVNIKPMMKKRPTIDGQEPEKESEDDKPKKVRKVNELAHANFRSLKLRNRGSKGGPGYGSKFRRRR